MLLQFFLNLTSLSKMICCHSTDVGQYLRIAYLTPGAIQVDIVKCIPRVHLAFQLDNHSNNQIFIIL